MKGARNPVIKKSAEEIKGVGNRFPVPGQQQRADSDRYFDGTDHGVWKQSGGSTGRVFLYAGSGRPGGGWPVFSQCDHTE